MNTSVMEKPTRVGPKPALAQVIFHALRSIADKAHKFAAHAVRMPTVTPSKRDGWIQ